MNKFDAARLLITELEERERKAIMNSVVSILTEFRERFVIAFDEVIQDTLNKVKGEGHHANTDGNRRDDANADVSRRDDANTDGSRRDDANTDGNRSDDANTDGNRSDDANADVSRLDDANTDGSRLDDTNTDGSRRDDANTDGSRRDDANTDGSRRDDANQDDPREEDTGGEPHKSNRGRKPKLKRVDGFDEDDNGHPRSRKANTKFM